METEPVEPEMVECPQCAGEGNVDCYNCDNGQTECPHCGADMNCDVCNGAACLECDKCDGTGEIEKGA